MKRRGTVATSSEGLLVSGNGASAPFRTIGEISGMLLVCERTVRRWLACKKLTSHQFGGTIRIAAGDLIVFFAQARRGRACVGLRNPLEDTFCTAENVAEILNVCIRTVRRRIDAGVLVAHDFHGIIRIADSDLRDFIDRSRRDCACHLQS